ncbi:MAG: hypothetical protein ABI364_04065 [Caldimonas sp.]
MRKYGFSSWLDEALLVVVMVLGAVATFGLDAAAVVAALPDARPATFAVRRQAPAAVQVASASTSASAFVAMLTRRSRQH